MELSKELLWSSKKTCSMFIRKLRVHNYLTFKGLKPLEDSKGRGGVRVGSMGSIEPMDF